MASKEFIRGFQAAVAHVACTFTFKAGSGEGYQLERLQLDAKHGMLPEAVEEAEKPAPRVTSEGTEAPAAATGDAPPKRKRRTRAEIEADKAAQEAS